MYRYILVLLKFHQNCHVFLVAAALSVLRPVIVVVVPPPPRPPPRWYMAGERNVFVLYAGPWTDGWVKHAAHPGHVYILLGLHQLLPQNIGHTSLDSRLLQVYDSLYNPFTLTINKFLWLSELFMYLSPGGTNKVCQSIDGWILWHHL